RRCAGVHFAASRLHPQDGLGTLDGRAARELQLHALSRACKVRPLFAFRFWLLALRSSGFAPTLKFVIPSGARSPQATERSRGTCFSSSPATASSRQNELPQ